MIAGAIFDLDGLMVNSEPLALQAWHACLQPHGISLTEAQYRYMLGISHPDSLSYILEQTGVGLPAEALSQGFWDNLIALVEAGRLEAMAGLLPLVAAFERRGLALGVASNSLTAYVRKALAALGLERRFGCVVGADQVALGKPAPDVYLAAVRGLGLPPQSCLALEDTPTGVRSALAAGLRCVYIPNPDLEAPQAGNLSANPPGCAVYPSLVAFAQALEGYLQGLSV